MSFFTMIIMILLPTYIHQFTIILHHNQHHRKQSTNKQSLGFRQAYEPCDYNMMGRILERQVEQRKEQIEVMEKVCEDEPNTERWGGSRFVCRQRYDTKTFFVDNNKRNIKPWVVYYKASCELRYANKFCKDDDSKKTLSAYSM